MKHRGTVLAALGLLCSLLATSPSTGAPPPPLREGFASETVFTGLDQPISADFSPDGRVFVGEKSGLIKVFENFQDPDPEVFADLRENVYNANDRGLLAITLDPEFPADPYVYALYSFNAEIGGEPPKWTTSSPEASEGVDVCPDPPGSHDDGCVIAGRLSRLEVTGGNLQEDVLVEDWCQQFSSHSIGDVEFLPDGTLLASGGDGAGFAFADYGQRGDPKNPCGDPPAGVGGKQRPPDAEGGALRSQDLRTDGDPVGLDGTLIRIDPTTGEGVPENPLADAAGENKRRVVAHGFRNPFRFAIRPGTKEVYVSDTGWRTWEEIDRVRLGGDPPLRNFGWPCYEGKRRQEIYADLGLKICNKLYKDAGAVTPPWFTYKHFRPMTGNETCRFRGGAGSGIIFYDGTRYPQRYRGGLFFTDYTRGCIWWMQRDGSGRPDPSSIKQFAVVGPIVDLVAGPGGDLFYVDITGSIGRFAFGNFRSPNVKLKATPRYGPIPLTVEFDASGSTDPSGGQLSYEWDLDDDGNFDDATGPTVTRQYMEAENRRIRVRVTNSNDRRAYGAVTISPGNTPPTLETDAPEAPWRAGDRIDLEAEVTDDQEEIDGSAVSWNVSIRHCASKGDCHLHDLASLQGTQVGFKAPQHEYPADLRVVAEVTDSRGLSTEDRFKLLPKVSKVRLESRPEGLRLSGGVITKAAPFVVKVISGSDLDLGAPLRQQGLRFKSWSNGRPRIHSVTVYGEISTYVARYI